MSDFEPARVAAERLTNVLHQRLPALLIHRTDQLVDSAALPGEHPLDAQQWVDKVLRPLLNASAFADKRCWLNMTGGTKALSLALLTRLTWDGVDYKPAGTNELLHFTLSPCQPEIAHLESPTEASLRTPLLEVAAIDVARLYNTNVTARSTDESPLAADIRTTLAGEIFKALDDNDAALLALFKLLNEVWYANKSDPTFNVAAVTLTDAEITLLIGQPLTADIQQWVNAFDALLPGHFMLNTGRLTFPGNGKLSPQASTLKRWLTSEWLEQLLYDWIQEGGVPAHSIALNVEGGEDKRNSSTQREADLLIQHHSRTHVIEVKVTAPPTPDMRAIQTQLTSLQDHFGRAQLLLFVGPQFRRQISEEKWLAFVDRVTASKSILCTNRHELLAALKLSGQPMETTQRLGDANDGAVDKRSHCVALDKAPPKPQTPSLAPQRSPSRHNLPETLKQHCHKVFIYTAWGENDPERCRDIEQIQRDILALNHPHGLSTFELAQRHGRHAYELHQQLKQKLATHGDGESVKEWLKTIKQHSAARVFRHLSIELDKWRKDQLRRQQRHQTGTRTFRSTLTPVKWKTGSHHPKSLASLSPASRWEILIDETGREFDSTAEPASLKEVGLGRVVAIVKAHDARLPPISPHFHGKDEPPEAVDRALQHLIDTPQVGIFGFSVKDPIAFGSYWMNHVSQLVRWVLYMLPVEENQPTRVDVSIEQRSGYTPDHNHLKALSQTLEGEFKALDQARFARLSLRLSIVGKTHPQLAYADAVAYTWGSPSAVSDDRLKKAKLLGPCLLHPYADNTLAHLYQALSYHDQLPPDQWYELCGAAERDGPYGLLERWLTRLGEKVKKERGHWHRLLNEVQQRLRYKDTSLVTLSAALAWLERFMPADTTLSGELRLEFVSARLALANHHGHVDMDALKTLLKLSQQLEDENAPAVCQALLRAAVTTTNHFEFGVMAPMLNEWVNKPIAVAGRLNHVKLHSTLGQLAAFEHRLKDADAHFTKALAVLAPLSDAQQAAREHQQTRSYQVMARLDDTSRPALEPRSELEALLLSITRRQDLPGVARRFAAGGSGSDVYLHHLLLRACLGYPDKLQDVIIAYREQSHAWQWHTGHPWGLIHAYRGWLLLLAATPDKVRAEQHFHAALAICFDSASGITLHWMGVVLNALATSLLPAFQAKVSAPKTLNQTLASAPHQARNKLAQLSPQAPHDARYALLAECLPFNFH
ncbi:hypothetical protein [Halomonas sp. GFAJ-1]|uniref:hypothetical protein n=1 Tax=Halomonas sp. GFAJ-1 TaxID=1118153 RepID=UPI0002D5DF32|nr:hypothetical protein [Halomonas sp. GFAJ-1]